MTQSASSPSFTVRRAADRGRAEHGWLSSRHTFSFADYHDPRWMGFRSLRVINDDRVAAAKGFGTHGHKDMEIVSYVLAGELGHKDSMGNGSVIVPGDVQRMSAGTGVLHSEMNPSPTSPVHFLQIWIQPSERGIAPGYEQKRFSREDKLGVMRLVASPDGSAGSVVIHADARLYASIVEAGTSVTHAVPSGRHTWIHVAKGEVTLGDLTLDAGDAAFSSDAGTFTLSGDGEVLVFDLG